MFSSPGEFPGSAEVVRDLGRRSAPASAARGEAAGARGAGGGGRRGKEGAEGGPGPHPGAESLSSRLPPALGPPPEAVAVADPPRTSREELPTIANPRGSVAGRTSS